MSAQYLCAESLHAAGTCFLCGCQKLCCCREAQSLLRDIDLSHVMYNKTKKNTQTRSFILCQPTKHQLMEPYQFISAVDLATLELHLTLYKLHRELALKNYSLNKR